HPQKTVLRRLGGGFGLSLALLARHGLFRVVARLALGNTGGIEEAHHAVRRLCAFGEPSLYLVHVQLEPTLIVLRQQRIEMAETLDESAIPRKTRVRRDHVIDRTLLGARTSEADDDWHWVLLQSSSSFAIRHSRVHCARTRKLTRFLVISSCPGGRRGQAASPCC